MKKMTDETMREFLRQKEEYDTLIAAAPDLLAAARQALMYVLCDPETESRNRLRDALSQAIGKATGEEEW